MALALCTAGSALAGSDIAKFFGKYRIEWSDGGDKPSVALVLINSKHQAALAGDEGTRGADYARFAVQTATDLDGPETVPLATLHLIRISDEDSTDVAVRLAMVREMGGQAELTVLDALETFHDAPNEHTSVKRTSVKVARWDKARNQWVRLKSF